MAKPKLTFSVAPTFKASVPIPVAGVDKTIPAEFEFKHRLRSDLDEWIASVIAEGTRIDTRRVQEMAVGWEFAEPFDDEHITKLLELYGGSGLSIYATYVRELTDAKLGNFVR